MTENAPGSETPASQPRSPIPKRLVVAALLAGMAVSAALLYVRAPADGNRLAASGVGAGECSDASKQRAREAGAAATGQVAAMLAAEPPRPMGSLAFTGPDGKPVSIAQFAGKPILVNLWATWCAPCRAEMPALDALNTELAGDSFEVVAINLDTGDDKKPKKFLQETGIKSLKYYRDSTLGVFEALKEQGLVTGLPATFLVDTEGCLIATMNGPAVWDGADAKAFIRAVTVPDDQ